MLHVANGDEAISALRAAGLPGEVVAWSRPGASYLVILGARATRL